MEATDEALEGYKDVQVIIRLAPRYGRVLHSKDECSVERGNFEIKPWPVQACIHLYMDIK